HEAVGASPSSAQTSTSGAPAPPSSAPSARTTWRDSSDRPSAPSRDGVRTRKRAGSRDPFTSPLFQDVRVACGDPAADCVPAIAFANQRRPAFAHLARPGTASGERFEAVGNTGRRLLDVIPAAAGLDFGPGARP